MSSWEHGGRRWVRPRWVAFILLAEQLLHQDDVALSSGSSSTRWLGWGSPSMHLAPQDFVVAASPNNLCATEEKRADPFVSGMERGVPGSELLDLRIDWFGSLCARMKESTGIHRERTSTN